MLHGEVPSLLGIHQAFSWYPSITELLKLRTPDSTPPPPISQVSYSQSYPFYFLVTLLESFPFHPSGTTASVLTHLSCPPTSMSDCSPGPPANSPECHQIDLVTAFPELKTMGNYSIPFKLPLKRKGQCESHISKSHFIIPTLPLLL